MIQSREQILQALDTAREDHPDQNNWLNFFRALLVTQWEAERALPPLTRPVTAARVDARRQAQHPLFTFDELELDWFVIYGLLRQLDRIATQNLPDWPATATLEIGEESARTWYQGQLLADPHKAFVIGQVLRPFLRRAATAAQPHLKPELYQRWGSCPVCGGEPDFSTLDPETGARRLYCSRCDTDWRYKRVGCPFCDTENPRKLAYYPSDDHVYRLYICDGCNRYLKTMDLRETVRPFLLPVERILTAGMDLAAAEAGYQSQRPAASVSPVSQ